MTEDLDLEPALSEEEASAREDQILMLYGDVFFKLAQFPRFAQFLEVNYNVVLETNELTKSVCYNVSEKPPSEVVEIMQGLIAKNKAQQAPTIVTASSSDISKFSR